MQALEQAMDLVAPGGSADMVGAGGFEANLNLAPGHSLMGRTSLRGVFMGSSNVKRDIPSTPSSTAKAGSTSTTSSPRPITLDGINDADAALAHDNGVARSVVTF